MQVGLSPSKTDILIRGDTYFTYTLILDFTASRLLQVNFSYLSYPVFGACLLWQL